MQVTIEKAKGYTGKKAEKSWVAQITGATATTLEREFLEADSRDFGDSKLYKQSKGTWTETFALATGNIYEICEYGDLSYRIIWARGSKLVSRTVTAGALTEALLVCWDADDLMASFSEMAEKAFAETAQSKSVTLLMAAQAAVQGVRE